MKYFKTEVKIISMGGLDTSVADMPECDVDYYTWINYETNNAFIKTIRYTQESINTLLQYPGITELTEQDFNQSIQEI